MSSSEFVQPGFGHTVVEDIRVAMSDGVELVLDLHVPLLEGRRGEGPLPVIVERTPYGRKGQNRLEFGREAAERGFIFACQDVRGRGDSQGHFHLMTNVPDEGQDGAETLAWVVRQPWCDGRIATVGGSFSAAKQAAALHHPTGLYTQILRDCGNNYYQRMFRYHGAFNIGVILPWIVKYGAISHEVGGDSEAKAALEEMAANLGTWAQKLPLERGGSPLAKAPSYEDIYFRMLETSDDVPYWQNVTVRLEGHWDDYPTDLSVMMISGWFAHHAAANLEKFNEFGCRLRGPVRLVIGPWSHGAKMLEQTCDGDAYFGPAAQQYGPISARWLDWIEDRLAAKPLAVPRLSYFHMGGGDGHRTPAGQIDHGGVWRETESWPVQGTIFKPFYLTVDGSLSESQPSTESASHYSFDPRRPTPGIGAVTLPRDGPAEFVLEGPRIQRCKASLASCRGTDGFIADRDDVLVFETDPLGQHLDITGPVTVRLWVSSSALDTDFAAQLVDVYPPSADYPEGCPLLITEGILRMRYRDRQPRADLIEPGKVYPIEIELGPTSNRFVQGHRLRLTVCSARFPQYDVNPNTGEPLGCATRTEVAHQTLWHSATRPSQLVLPVVPGWRPVQNDPSHAPDQ